MNIGCLIYIGAGICLLLVVAVVLVEAAYDDGFADGYRQGLKKKLGIGNEKLEMKEGDNSAIPHSSFIIPHSASKEVR